MVASSRVSVSKACSVTNREREDHLNRAAPTTCEANARAIIEAMQDEEGWAVVGGFAIGESPDYPTQHVWVRKGDTHFDPTWSRKITNARPIITQIVVPIDKYRYFVLPGIFPDGDVLGRIGLNYLTEKAAELGIDLLEYHQWDKPEDPV
jgi:hypothetical protein